MSESAEELQPVAPELSDIPEAHEQDEAVLERTLQKLRTQLKAAERDKKAMERLMDADQQRSFNESKEREERLRLQAEQRIKEEVEAARAEVLQQVKVKDQKLTEALAEKSELYRKQALANAFQAAGGRSGGADDGTTYLDALMAVVGPRFKVTDAGDVVVINANGEPMLTENGDPLTPVAYLEQLKSQSVYGHFFAPTNNGHGGGMRGSGNLTTGSLQGMSTLDKINYGLGA